jgi:hypothetical protein
LRAPCRHDRLSALPDDLLLLILRRLDTRTALATATLSKRWAYLPRCFDTLDFRVSDILPARYYRCIRIRHEVATCVHGIIDFDPKLARDNIERYERRAMRAMVSSINSFIDADDVQDRCGLRLRSVRTLQLEFFVTHCSSGINRLIAKAADSWGVEDLEVSAKGRQGAHRFPRHGLCNNPHKSRLRSLKLAACYIPPLKGFHALSSLVLQDLPTSTPSATYENIFTLCPQLQALHLKSCMVNQGGVAIHAPKSEIKQLVIEWCWFGRIKLYTLPMLESLAVVESNVSYKLSSFPHLTHLNVTLRFGIKKTRSSHVKTDHDLTQYLGGTPGITNLIIRFTGYDRWFKHWSPTLLLPKLRRLLIADVPSSWDVSWPRLLIEAAPCLESLHIHISPWEEQPCDDILWQPSEFCHNQLKELVIAGFHGTERQIYFVNFVIKVSMSLQLVSLHKNGYVQDRGCWDWDMVTQQYQWVNEKVKILNQIADSSPCAAIPIQVVLE